MRLTQAIKHVKTIRNEISAVLRIGGPRVTGAPNQSTVEALDTLIELAEKVSTPRPRNSTQTAVCEMVRMLLHAKNQQAPVQITDTEGSFTDDQIITVDESQNGEEVNIVLQYVKL